MPAYVYIVRCADNSLYVGLTRATLEKRLGEHNAGIYRGFTYKRRPVRLAWHVECQMIIDAIGIERKLKGWSRAKKEALIAGDFDLLRSLSRRYGRTPKPE